MYFKAKCGKNLASLIEGNRTIYYGASRGKINIGMGNAWERLQRLLSISATMVAVHTLDGKGELLGSFVMRFLMLIMAMTFTLVAATAVLVAAIIIVIIAVAVCIVAMTALVMAMAMRVTKEMAAQCIEEQEK